MEFQTSKNQQEPEKENGEKEKGEKDGKEQRIRNITLMYYSRPDIQKAIFEFSKNREVVPKYFDVFGKRPDAFQYPGEIFQAAKNRATSFHCSEELWKDPLKISTGMNESELNDLRIGWDLLIDIDSKYLDYSRVMAELVIKMLNFHGVKNIGIKFSGSKGFHIIVPWKSFPKEINGVPTSKMFPQWPRIIVNYLNDKIQPELVKKITKLSLDSDNLEYVKDFQASKEVIPDMILVSPRHLFRSPYSLHEKTSLSSCVLNPEELGNFHPKDADPMKVKVRNFLPDSEEGEATQLIVQALDWYKENNLSDSVENKTHEKKAFAPIKLDKISEEFFPPSIKKILQGLHDGRKRALFILINLFRSMGMEREELEKRVYDWNKKNKVPLKDGYIKAQILWSYRNRITPPPNYNKDYYKGIGIVPTEEEVRLKNPLNYILKKAQTRKTGEKGKSTPKKSREKGKVKESNT